MAFTWSVGPTIFGGDVDTASVTLTGCTAGRKVIGSILHEAPAQTPSVSCSGETVTMLGTATGTNWGIQHFECVLSGSGSKTFSYTTTGGQSCNMWAGEITGGVPTFDTSNTAAGTGANSSAGITTTGANGIIIASAIASTATSVQATYTSVGLLAVVQAGDIAEYLLDSGAAGAKTVGFTHASGNYALSVAAWKPASAASLVTGWDYITEDATPSKAKLFSAPPAFVSTFQTAGIAGISWSGPRDHVKLPPSVVFSTPPAFGRSVTTPVPISGMAWDTLHETDILPRGKFLTEPAPVTFIPQTSTWSFLVGDTTFLKDPPVDSPPGFGQVPLSTPVGIAGMAWQTPLDRTRPAYKVTIETPPALQLIPGTLPTPVSGIAWFEPPDRDRPATKINGEAPIAYVRPPTVFTPISGIAWQEPLDLITVKPSFSCPPAFGREIVAPVPISGMAWFEPPPCTVKVAVSFSESPALQQPIVQIAPPVIPPDVPPVDTPRDQSTILSNHKAGGGGSSFSKRDLDRIYDEWRRKKPKNAAIKQAVKEAVEVLEEVSTKGLLATIEPAIELKETIEALPAKPLAAVISDIREQTRILEAMLDEDEEEIMLMVWALD